MALGSRVQGDLDEVQVYQRPLNSAQVLALLASPAAQSSQTRSSTTSAKAPTVAGNFTYKHPSLEDCYETDRAPRFTDAYSRMQERPHSACWTTWIGHGGWEEYDDNGVKKHRNRTAWWVKLFPGPLRIPAKILDKVTDDDVFTFRVTWVAHTYIGDSTGNAVYKAGTAGAGLKPQDIKFFVKLSDFGVWNRGVRQTQFDDDLDDVQIEFDLDTQGCQVQKGNPTQLKTIADWRSTQYLEYLINTPRPSSHDREVCSIMPAIAKYNSQQGKNEGRLPLWDQEVLAPENGKRLGVVRWGQGTPANSLWSPSFRCDWRELGLFGTETANAGGCIYIRADRVFTMSKSRDDEFLDVILHIEKALNPATNAATYPPYRPGDKTEDRKTSRPPSGVRWATNSRRSSQVTTRRYRPPLRVPRCGEAPWASTRRIGGSSPGLRSRYRRTTGNYHSVGPTAGTTARRCISSGATETCSVTSIPSLLPRRGLSKIRSTTRSRECGKRITSCMETPLRPSMASTAFSTTIR
jgi:hypothetical protein